MLSTSLIKSDRVSDYQKMRIEMVSLVNAASNRLSGLGETQAGIHLQLPAENIPGNRKVYTREYIISPGEMARKAVDEATIVARIREVAARTPIRHEARANEDTVLDPASPYFAAALKRLLPIIESTMQNFRRDLAELLQMYDALTQPNMQVPHVSAFHAQAMFEHRELLEMFRTAQGMPPLPEPSLTPEVRTMLQKFGVPVHQIADRSAVLGIPSQVLASYVQKSEPREATQGKAHGKEVQLILHVLGQAIVRNEIPGLVMDEHFRGALQQAVEDARIATTVAATELEQADSPLA